MHFLLTTPYLLVFGLPSVSEGFFPISVVLYFSPAVGCLGSTLPTRRSASPAEARLRPRREPVK